jgi:hypothetical protein
VAIEAKSSYTTSAALKIGSGKKRVPADDLSASIFITSLVLRWVLRNQNALVDAPDLISGRSSSAMKTVSLHSTRNLLETLSSR